MVFWTSHVRLRGCPASGEMQWGKLYVESIGKMTVDIKCTEAPEELSITRHCTVAERKDDASCVWLCKDRLISGRNNRGLSCGLDPSGLEALSLIF